MMLDIRTLMLLYLVINVISAGALALILGQTRGRFAGIAFWLADIVLQVIGSTLIILRGIVPDLVSMVLANTLIQCGALVILIGLERFTGQKGRHVHNYLLLAAFIAVMAYFTMARPSLAARDIALSLVAMIYTFQCCWLLLRRVPPGMRQVTRLTGLVFAAYAVFSLARIILTVIFPAPGGDYFKAGVVDAMAMLVYIILSVCLIISLVLMVNRRLLENVKSQEEKFTVAFRSSPYAITLTRPSDGKIFEVNDGFVNITGHRYSEVIGKTTVDLRLWERSEDRLAVVSELTQGREVHAVEYEFRKKSGETLTGLFSASLITVNGESCILSSIGDVTDRKRLEEERQRLARLESVGLLAAGIAHDFNNVLTSILGNISLASREAAPGSELRHSLEQAEKASLRAKDLTVQLLTFSKGGAPVKKITSMGELLRDTAGFALHGSNVKCRFSIDPELWDAEIDPGQVSQAIHNMVINAQQSMPAGGTMELRAENISLTGMQSLGKRLPIQDGNYIRVAVADRGAGIPPDSLEKIFDPFFTTRQKGTGLGLTTSFSIARRHGGHISVESEVGSGSIFYLYLPASAETAGPAPDKVEAIKSAGKARILVMDDEQGIREVAGRMLKHIGYEDVGFAADGAGAVRLYEAAMKSGNPFEAVIMDLTIPGGMGGEAAVQNLLKLDPEARVIVSSGYADDPVMSNFREYGFRGMVTKPYTFEELGRVLQEVMGAA